MIKTNIILQGDALSILKTLPDESVNCLMTSPPYFNQRDYDIEGQLGLEKTPEEYVMKLCDIFSEVKRVLRNDGTCWVNISDCYGGFQGKNAGYPDSKTKADVPQIKRDSRTAKSLLCVPEMFLLEMVKRGWLIRNKIIWFKNNVMPSSASDRFTIDFEMLYFFVKQKKYYFEQQFEQLKTKENRPFGAVRQREYNYNSKYEGIHFEKKVRQGMHKDRGKNFIEKRELPKQDEIVEFLKEWTNGFEDDLDKEFGEHKWRHWIRNDDSGFSYPSKEDWTILKNMLDFPDTYDKQMLEVELKTDKIRCSKIPKQDLVGNPTYTGFNKRYVSPSYGRNKRCVWNINTKPSKVKHFAIYPEELCETPIKAGCPEGGIVLDPFFGAGTTGLVALKQNKKFIGIELNPEYIEIAKKRLKPYLEQRKLKCNKD